MYFMAENGTQKSQVATKPTWHKAELAGAANTRIVPCRLWKGPLVPCAPGLDVRGLAQWRPVPGVRVLLT